MEKAQKEQKTCLTLPGTPGELVLACAGELSAYFSGRRTCFDLPLAPEGTPFQKRVWEALVRIPVMILIPCHRVIGADGSLTGYACGLEVKKRLLALEQGKPIVQS